MLRNLCDSIFPQHFEERNESELVLLVGEVKRNQLLVLYILLVFSSKHKVIVH